MAELIAILRPHWEAHQDEEGTPLSVESRARQIAKDLRQRDLTASMEGMNLDDRGSSTAFSQQLAAALVELLDNVMISIVETENRSKEAVEGLLELTAAVATDDVEACGTVLARAVELSETQVDHVRCAAGKTIGWITKYITKQHKVSEYNDILDTASQALLPLFTDKTQPTRLAAIRAGVHFFQKDATDPEVLQSLLWSCQHDPSVSNRVAAVESVPITLETIDFLVQRVRDVKSKVRVASLQALRNKCNDFSILESYHCVTIVQAGYTERCALTKQATEELICLGWMKLVKYEPIELLKHMAVSENDTICDTVVSILLKAASTESTILSGLSEAEVRAFRQGIDKATATLSEDIFSDNSMITGPRLFMSVTACKHAATQREKDMLINQLVPDMAVLCQYLDQNAGKLIQAIEEDNQEAEDELVFICVQLMRLAVVADVEEGSRRLLATALQRLLVSVITPDDLVEEAVCTLQSISRDDSRFMDQISSTVREVDDLAEHDDELAVNRQLRILAILSIVFERITPDHCSKNTLDEFSRQITPSLSKSNQLVREAGVSCLGKLGLFMATNTVENEYQPMMLEILSNEEEKHEVRAQAMLALADWSLLNELHPRFAEVISRALHREGYPEGLVLVAAEVATKLLLVGKIHNHNWLAALLVLLFDPSTNLDDDEEEDDDILQVGNPIRVQQVLTVFFPAYCIRQESAKQEMVRCISPAIDTAANKRKNKKHASRGTGRKPSRAAWPMSKMLDYVLSSTEQEAEPKEEDDDETPDMNTPERGGSTNKKNETSVALLVTIQVALYLEKSMDDLSVTLCRALFKWIGSVDIDVSTEQPEHLSKLRRSLDELEMATSDSSSLRSLAPLMEQLSDVSAEEENDDSSSEGGDTGSPESAASLVEGFENFGINAVETPTYAKENEFASAATSDKADLTFDRRVSLESRSVNRA